MTQSCHALFKRESYLGLWNIGINQNTINIPVSVFLRLWGIYIIVIIIIIIIILARTSNKHAKGKVVYKTSHAQTHLKTNRKKRERKKREKKEKKGKKRRGKFINGKMVEISWEMKYQAMVFYVEKSSRGSSPPRHSRNNFKSSGLGNDPWCNHILPLWQIEGNTILSNRIITSNSKMSPNCWQLGHCLRPHWGNSQHPFNPYLNIAKIMIGVSIIQLNTTIENIYV